MIYDWLQLIECTKRSEREYYLFGRYNFVLNGSVICVTDSFDNFKLLGSEEIKDFAHFLNFVYECITKVEKWN